MQGNLRSEQEDKSDPCYCQRLLLRRYHCSLFRNYPGYESKASKCEVDMDRLHFKWKVDSLTLIC